MVKKSSLFIERGSLIAFFAAALHFSLSSARFFHSKTLHPISWWSTLLLSFAWRLVIPSDHLLLHWPTKIIYKFLLSNTRAICPTHLIFLYFTTPTSFIEDNKWRITLICNSISSVHYLFHLRPRYFFSTRLLNACSVTDGFLTPFQNNRQSGLFLYSLILMHLHIEQDDKIF